MTRVVGATNKELVIMFNIFIVGKYHKVAVVGDEVVLQAKIIGLGKFMKKIQCIVYWKRTKNFDTIDVLVHISNWFKSWIDIFVCITSL